MSTRSPLPAEIRYRGPGVTYGNDYSPQAAAGLLCFNHKIPGVSGDHQFFVGLHDPNGDPTVYPGNDLEIAFIQALVQDNAEKSQGGTDSRPDDGRVLTNAAGKDQGVKSSQGGGQGSDEFPRLIAEDLHRQTRVGLGARLGHACRH